MAAARQDWTAAEVAALLAPLLEEAHLPSPTAPVGTVQSSSRSVQSSDVFVALRGPRHDGHAYLEQAAAAGASLLVCQQKSASAGGVNLVRVRDSDAAYRQLAAAWRRRFSLPLVAVIGSVGKTSSKEMLAAMLRGHFGTDGVLQTQASQNGFSGIAATLLSLRATHRAAVIEVGIDAPSTMAQHMHSVQPTHVLLTALGAEHLAGLGNEEQACAEEWHAVQWVLERGGLAFVPEDDAHVTRLRTSLAHERLLVYPRGDEPQLEAPMVGEHQARNCLGAWQVARCLGTTPAEAAAGLQTFEIPPGRGELRTTRHGVHVVCDFYNANPSSMRASLASLAATPRAAGKRLWLMLGDMLELGGEEQRYHRELATPLQSLAAECTWLAGPCMRALAEQLAQAGAAGDCRHFVDVDALLMKLRASPPRGGDWVLLKGSRGMQMERVWHFLDADR